MILRAAEARDFAAIDAVETAAFGQPDEARLIRRLRDSGAIAHELVAEREAAIVGHVVFSRMTASETALPIVALGPVAVNPDAQGAGVGSALIREGLDRCRAYGFGAVFVLGHAAYYPRFGFDAALAAGVASPYAGPNFMALELIPGALKGVRRVDYPAAFASLGDREHSSREET